jgi:hypothetical protein
MARLSESMLVNTENHARSLLVKMILHSPFSKKFRNFLIILLCASFIYVALAEDKVI